MRKRMGLLFFAIIPIILGCSTVTDYVREENFQFSPVLRNGEAVAIISNKESMFRGCLSEAINNNNLNLNIIASKEFRKKILNNPRNKEFDQSLEGLVSTLKDSKVSRRLRESNLRYVIFIQFRTDSKYSETECAVGGAPGAAVVLCDHQWQRDTRVEANLVDVKQDFGTGRIIAKTSGKIHLLTTCLIPTIAWSATTESDACEAFANKIVTYCQNNKSEKNLTERLQLISKKPK